MISIFFFQKLTRLLWEILNTLRVGDTRCTYARIGGGLPPSWNHSGLRACGQMFSTDEHTRHNQLDPLSTRLTII